MFCINCGKPVGENDRFCAYCGSEVNVSAYQSGSEQKCEPGQDTEMPGEGCSYDSAAPEADYGCRPGTASETEYGAEAAYVFKDAAAAGQSPEDSAGSGVSITDAVRKLGSSPLFFAGIILAAASAVFEFISLLSAVPRYALFSGEDFALSVTAGVSVAGVAGLIMAAVSIAGMIIFYASNKYGDSDAIKTGGLSVVKVMAVIRCILMIVFSAVVLATGIFMTVRLSMYGAGLGEDETAAVVLIFVFFAVLLILLILIDIFNIKLLMSIQSILNTARTGIAAGSISLYVIVLLFILAFAGLAAQLIAAVGFVSVISALTGAAVNVIFAVILIKYRQLFVRAGCGRPL